MNFADKNDGEEVAGKEIIRMPRQTQKRAMNEYLICYLPFATYSIIPIMTGVIALFEPTCPVLLTSLYLTSPSIFVQEFWPQVLVIFLLLLDLVLYCPIVTVVYLGFFIMLSFIHKMVEMSINTINILQ